MTALLSRPIKTPAPRTVLIGWVEVVMIVLAAAALIGRAIELSARQQVLVLIVIVGAVAGGHVIGRPHIRAAARGAGTVDRTGEDRPSPVTPIERDLAPPLPVETPSEGILRRATAIVRELSHYKQFLAVLHAQIGNVAGETESAALEILTRLGQIDQGVQALIGFLEHSGTSANVVDLMAQSEMRMVENRRLLEEFRTGRDQAAQESEQKLGEIRDIVTTLNRVVGEVRAFARQTNMLAINAAIEAAQAGEAGKGFAVVAAEVKQLSRASDQAAVDIHGGIARLQEAISASMETMIHKRLAAETQGFEAISASISETTRNFDILISHQRDVLERAHADSALISRPIIELIGSIQFQDITRQELNHVAAAMDTLGRHAEQLGRHLEDDNKHHILSGIEAEIDNLQATYVMSQQRNIHGAVVGSADHEDKGALVELF